MDHADSYKMELLQKKVKLKDTLIMLNKYIFGDKK